MGSSWWDYSVIDSAVVLLIFLSMWSSTQYSRFPGFPLARAGGVWLYVAPLWQRLSRLLVFTVTQGEAVRWKGMRGSLTDWRTDGLSFIKTEVDLLSKRDNWDWKGRSVALSSPLLVFLSVPLKVLATALLPLYNHILVSMMRPVF